MTNPLVSGTGTYKDEQGNTLTTNKPQKIDDEMFAKFDADFTFPEGQTLFSFDGIGIYINYLFHERYIKTLINNRSPLSQKTSTEEPHI